MKSKLAIALLIAGLLSIGAWRGYGQTGKEKNVTYEYAVIDDPTEKLIRDAGVHKLNEFGAQGWEIVGVSSKAPDSYTRLYLKRTIK
ncbi:MAG TPA: hypothetical protein VHS05_00010 [Pyrinomonadaceae bacterium]|nr:hypothetical protein [Pyrinomonadaceae bacterium]